MRILLTSLSLIESANGIDEQTIKILIDISKSGSAVGIVSGRPKPAWFDDRFSGTGVTFFKRLARRDGNIVTILAKKASVKPYEILVLAATKHDLAMAKNGGAMLIAAGWVSGSEVKNHGVSVKDTQELIDVIDILDGWKGGWWAKATSPTYNICVLADLSSYQKTNDQMTFSSSLKATVKQGGVKLTALLTLSARSLLFDQIGGKPKLVFGVYPSSNSSNDDTEVLSRFTHSLRTTVSQIQFAKENKPLFIRHAPSTKRSAFGTNTDRLDPSEQIETLHLNKYYKGKIKNRNVIVVDDCTTFGASFAVAAAFLLKGGASSVTGLALGKFGDKLHYFDIDINTDPFSPVVADQYEVKAKTPLQCVTNVDAQATLRDLL